MAKSSATVAQQLAQAASEFERRTTGHAPTSVTVVLSGDTLVVTLHGALSPAEKALAQSPAGAAQVQEFHRQLFTSSSATLRQEIKRITGVEVREAAAEVEPATGSVVKVFTTGTVVQVFLLARGAPADTWSGDGEVIDPEKAGRARRVRAVRPRRGPRGSGSTAVPKDEVGGVEEAATSSSGDPDKFAECE
jgi:uncharacterized protein YbcI